MCNMVMHSMVLSLIVLELLPEDDSIFTLLKKKRNKAKRKEHEGILDKSFEIQNFEKIKEWLES